MSHGVLGVLVSRAWVKAQSDPVKPFAGFKLGTGSALVSQHHGSAGGHQS